MLAPTLGHGGSYTYPGYPDAWGGHMQGMRGHDGPPKPNHGQDTTMLPYSQPYGMGKCWLKAVKKTPAMVAACALWSPAVHQGQLE